MLDERIGDRKFMLFYQRFQDLLACLGRLPRFLLGFQIVLNFLAQLGDGGHAAYFFRHLYRELVVQFRKLLFLDRLHFHGVIVGLAPELFVGIIIRIFSLELLGLAGIRAAQIFREALQRFFGADVAHDVVGFDGIASTFGHAGKFNQRVV